MTNLLIKLSNGKLLIPLFLLFGLFTFYLFPKYQTQINDIAGEEVLILDLRPTYTHKEVVTDFEKMQEEGRAIFQFIASKADMVYPIIYGLFAILLLAFFLKKIIVPGSNKIYFAFLPIVLVITDYLENFNHLKLLNSYPDIAKESVMTGATLTQLKHFFSMALFVFLIVLIVILIFQTLNPKKVRT